MRSSRVGSAYFFDELLGGRHVSGDPIFAHVASAAGSHNEKLSLLRRHYRHRVFSSGARDLYELRSVYESLPATTAIAEDAISAAYRTMCNGSPGDSAWLAFCSHVAEPAWPNQVEAVAGASFVD